MRPLGGEVRLEQPVHQRRWHADALILEHQHHRLAVHSRADADLAASRHRVGGVAQQVEEEVREIGGGGLHRRELRHRESDPHLAARRLGLQLEQRHRAVQDRADVHRLQPGRARPGEVVQPLDHRGGQLKALFERPQRLGVLAQHPLVLPQRGGPESEPAQGAAQIVGHRRGCLAQHQEPVLLDQRLAHLRQLVLAQLVGGHVLGPDEERRRPPLALEPQRDEPRPIRIAQPQHAPLHGGRHLVQGPHRPGAQRQGGPARLRIQPPPHATLQLDEGGVAKDDAAFLRHRQRHAGAGDAAHRVLHRVAEAPLLLAALDERGVLRRQLVVLVAQAPAGVGAVSSLASGHCSSPSAGSVRW